MEDRGLRHNAGKVRLDLLPPLAKVEWAKVMTQGAEKYAAHNWRKGMPYSEVLASMARHTAAFENGEDRDPESGCLHLGHIMANASFLIEYLTTHPEYDDRYNPILNRPKVALDIDEVLADWVGAYIERFKIPKRPTTWAFDWNFSSRIEELWTDEDFYMGLASVETVDRWNFEPAAYISSRKCPVEWTQKWLEKNGFPPAPVIHTQDKVEAMRSLGIGLLIDDSFDTFCKVNSAGLACYLLSAPHNMRYQVTKRLTSVSQLFE